MANCPFHTLQTNMFPPDTNNTRVIIVIDNSYFGRTPKVKQPVTVEIKMNIDFYPSVLTFIISIILMVFNFLLLVLLVF